MIKTTFLITTSLLLAFNGSSQELSDQDRILKIKTYDDSLYTFLLFDFQKEYSYYIEYSKPDILQSEGSFDITTYDSSLIYNDTISFFHSPVDGTMSIDIHRFHAKKQGIWKYYYSNGKLHYSGNYSKNLKNGVWKYYSDEGELQIIRNYLNGRIINQEILTHNSFVLPEW